MRNTTCGFMIGAVAIAAMCAAGAAAAQQGTDPGAAGSAYAVAAVSALASQQQDPADSVYKAAREALNRGQYRSAVDLFRELRERYPRSAYVGDAHYWEAFAHYRLGTTQDLQEGLRLLDHQAQRYAQAATRAEAAVLATRIQGQLAQRGDAAAAERLAVEGGLVVPKVGKTPPHGSEDDETRLAALNALLMMNSEQVVPLLREVLQRRDSGSVELRQRVIVVLAQKPTPETEEILLDVVQNDPDPEVRGMAVVFLGRSESERAYQALATVVRTTQDPELRKRAVAVLVQRGDERSVALVRDLARQPGADEELRTMAIVMLGRTDDPASRDFLRQLYASTSSVETKSHIVHAMSMGKRPEDRRWLIDRALDSNEPPEVREQALIIVGQQEDIPVADIIAIYDGVKDPEMRHRMVFVLSMRSEPAATDKLMDLARNDPNPEIRQQAIVMLGRSKDPRVAQFLMELIKK